MTTFDHDLDEGRLPYAHDAESERRRAARGVVVTRAMQVVSYLFGALYVLIGFEFVLEVFAARDRNGFKQLLDALTDPFLGPFRTLLPTLSVGGSEVIFSYVVALIVYAMIHLGLYRLAKILTSPRRTYV